MIFVTTAIAIAALVVLTARWFITDHIGIVSTGIIFLVILPLIYQIPIYGLPLIGYIGAVIGDISTLSTSLILFLALRPLVHWPNNFGPGACDVRMLLFPLAMVTVFFYPAALGMGIVDPYSWGFQPLVLFSVMVIYGIWLVRRNYLVSAAIIAVCLIAYFARIQESDNLWDYLLDPLLAVSCWVWSTRRLIAKIKYYHAQQT